MSKASHPASFVFYESFYKGISAIHDSKIEYDIYRALTEYGLYGTVPDDISDVARAFVISFGYQIDIAKEKHAKLSAAGKKGAAATNGQKTKAEKGRPAKSGQASANDNENINDNVNKNKNEKENHKRARKIAARKKVCGEFHNVLLAPSEVTSLKKLYPKDYKARIDRLSQYKKSSGRHYDDDYATIRLWAQREQSAEPSSEKQAMDDDTRAREQMLDDSYNADMEAIWAAVDRAAAEKSAASSTVSESSVKSPDKKAGERA